MSRKFCIFIIKVKLRVKYSFHSVFQEKYNIYFRNSNSFFCVHKLHASKFSYIWDKVKNLKTSAYLSNLSDFEAERENIIRGRTEKSSLNGGHATTTRSPASTRNGGSLPEKGRYGGQAMGKMEG